MYEHVSVYVNICEKKETIHQQVPNERHLLTIS